MIISDWQPNDIDLSLIDLALREDLGFPYFDITSDLLFPNRQKNGRAKIISKEKTPIVLCGIPIVRAIATKFDPTIQIETLRAEGKQILPGEILLTLTGPIQHLLMIERVILNFLQKLCAIATLTAQYVRQVAHTPAKILDTRKTTPGFRHLDKYAVLCGGGVNHRLGLYDALMVKDTHVDFYGGMANILAALPPLSDKTVIIEVRNTTELQEVFIHGQNKISRVLLDNMSISDMTTCVRLCAGQIPLEASGNISLDTIEAVALTGVDFISVGKITHSAKNVDLSMQCE